MLDAPGMDLSRHAGRASIRPLPTAAVSAWFPKNSLRQAHFLLFFFTEALYLACLGTMNGKACPAGKRRNFAVKL